MNSFFLLQIALYLDEDDQPIYHDQHGIARNRKEAQLLLEVTGFKETLSLNEDHLLLIPADEEQLKHINQAPEHVEPYEQLEAPGFWLLGNKFHAN